jgi:hypothetical protein
MLSRPPHAYPRGLTLVGEPEVDEKAVSGAVETVGVDGWLDSYRRPTRA